ncbi:MAG TPA: hypothetical protein VLD85_02485 [Anaeromyxobacteraceae bacterium]|jgi:hypothetical protein|nr:hypothetical protein [Anaeromyxobacteraceae bacterium]
MAANRKLVVVVRHDTGTVLGWLRKLLPAAVLLVAPVDLPATDQADVITVDADEVLSGPLYLAATLTRHREPPEG